MKFSVSFLLSTPLLFLNLFGEKPNPKSLEFTKWTPNFLVPDPVALSFDNQGRAYVTQTQRRKANDLDIRQNRDWIPDDLSFKTPDGKRAFYHKAFTSQNSDANKRRVKDFNKDGKHDLADLRFLSERIHLIEDTDSDGLADKTSIYAEGFTDEIGGIAAGVLHYDGDVYTTIVPDVWKLRDTNDDGKADQRQSIAYGFGVHLAYAGHDMHGLTVGPDGRIYWTIGDKGVGASSKEGRHFQYPNQGAVLRCDTDGSNFEVYARGLRNVQEIAFDQYGNMFGIDNDSDRPGEKERFVYIVQHMDAGWRSNWQYRNGTFNPWMDENLSIPWHKGQPAYITPPISLYNNGPAGLAFNPGTALGEEWQNYFFHTSAPNGQQWAFQVEQDGASFKMVNDMQIGNGVPIVGINFGPDGALYGVDWGGGYPLNEKGAIWKWDVKEKHPLRALTAKLLRSDFSKTATNELIATLNHPDQRARLKAQFELVKRGARKELWKAARSGPQLLRIHAIWGLCQFDRLTKSPKGDILELLSDPDPEIRTQIVRSFGEILTSELALHQAPGPRDSPFDFLELEKCLEDDSPRVRFHAAIALGNLGALGSSKALIKMARNIPDESNTYQRHAAIAGLTGCASSEILAALASEQSELIQKIAVVALRRRADPKVRHFLYSPFKNVVAEAARAIHDDWSIPNAIPALARSLATTKWIKDEGFIKRAINANFHLGTPEAATRVADYTIRADVPEELRLNALDALRQWSKPGKLDRVVGRYRPLSDRDPAIATNAVYKKLTNLLIDPSQKIQSEAMALARLLKIEIPGEALVAVAKNESSIPALRIEALRALATQKNEKLLACITSAFESKEHSIRIEALKILAKFNPLLALDRVEVVLSSNKANTLEKQTALALLGGDLASAKGDSILNLLLNSFEECPPSLKLDLTEAAAVRQINAPDPDFTHTLEGGDADRGRNLFMNHIAAQCIRCHKVKDGKGSDIGPNLKSAGLQGRGHHLEAIVDPQKTITEGYGSISLTLENGQSIAGLFKSEMKGVIEIKDAEGVITRVVSENVKERTPVISTMPPMGAILTKREIRDIIEYLSTLKSKK
ncbi:MAG: c-type cytochrome [Verrucomicrobiaceae bacterium]|nr:MAG: c-type cytochrome [Verrucomicrobiaceae bacterium]